jgi:hypothetical protein
MKKIIKKILIGLGGVLVLLIAFVSISAKLSNRNVAAQLGFLVAKTRSPFLNNNTLVIKYTGVMDENGNIAASGTSIPINAYLLDDDKYDLGVVGNIKNGTLTIKLPRIPKNRLEDLDENSKYQVLGPFNNIDLVNVNNVRM